MILNILSFLENGICSVHEALLLLTENYVHSSYIFIGATLLALIYLFVWVRNRRHEFSLFLKFNIPYVKPHWLYGNLDYLRNHPKLNSLEVMDEWMEKYGSCFGFFCGTMPHLVITDLDMIKEIMFKRSSNYINRPKIPIKADPVLDTLVGLRNQRWREVRKILSPAFTAAKLKLLLGTMNEKVDILLHIIEKSTLMNEELDILSVYQGLTLDLIANCAFAMETDCIRRHNDPFFVAVRKFLKDAMNKAVLWAHYLPCLAALMTIINNYWAKSGLATQMIIANLKKAIKIRRNEVQEKRVDILQVLLDGSEGDSRELGKRKLNDAKPLSDKEIIANSWVFLLGGYETTASALTFTTYLLAKHPEVQETLCKEITKHIAEGTDSVTYDNVMNLTYLDQVVNESLRMYPPVSSFIEREAYEQDEINGITIPRRVTIVVPVWQIHHNPLHWPDPYKFDPSRFSSEAKGDRHPLSFIPFGAGPRNCIGMRFGQVALKITLVKILLEYRLEATARTPDDLTLTVPTVTLIPKEKIYIRAVKRTKH